jgi:hypothetical protein
MKIIVVGAYHDDPESACGGLMPIFAEAYQGHVQSPGIYLK